MELQKIIPFPQQFPTSTKIIIDCDAGGDDAQAIILCFHLAKKYNKQIVAIFCCQGNTTIQNVIKNVLVCKGLLIENNLELKNSFPPIIKGASVNLIGDKIYASGDNFFHVDGLCSNQYKYKHLIQTFINFDKEYEQITNRAESAPEFYNRLARQYQGDLSIMAIGPLTNLALAYHYDQSFSQRISSLSIMGCQYSGMGMWDYFSADFNFNLDAHAAHIVMKVFSNVVVLSLEYAFAYKTQRIMDVFANKSTKKAEFVADIYAPIMKTFACPVLCDPQTAFPLFCPQQCDAKCFLISGVVETTGKRTKGFFALRNPMDQTEKKVIFITQMNKQFIQNQVVQSYL